MRNIIGFFLLAGIIITSCREGSDIDPKACSTSARFKNLETVGCGYVFELNDGTFLQPTFYNTPLFCATPPLPKEITEDPLYNIQLQDEELVYIDYVEAEGENHCSRAKLVEITCLRKSDPIPDCIKEKIEALENDPYDIGPDQVFRYTYQGKKVYYFPDYCCDFFSELYDENCNSLCAPSGGIMGGGDGNCPDFFQTRTDEELIWEDPTGGAPPQCIFDKIEEIKSESPRNPPAAIYQYIYQREKVFFIPQYCCDQFSDLLDKNCNLICHPDGGISGNGDGHCTDFFETRSNEMLIWKDDRD